MRRDRWHERMIEPILWVCFAFFVSACSPAVEIGEIGKLAGNTDVITVDEQATIRVAIANRSSNMEFANVIAQLVDVNARMKDTRTTPIALSSEILGAFMKAESAHDNEGIAQLLTRGLVFVVTNNTRVRVLDHEGGTMSKVRVLNGPMQGLAGCVPNEWVKPVGNQ